MKHEQERRYVARNESIDDAEAWNSGAMYHQGLRDYGMTTDASIMSTTPSGYSTSWSDTIKAAIPVLASAYQQKQLVDLNIARINKNLPPLTPDQFPATQVQVGATADTKRLMLYAAFGIAALIGLRAAKVI